MESPKITSQLNFVNHALESIALIKIQKEPETRSKEIIDLYLCIRDKAEQIKDETTPLTKDKFLSSKIALSKLIALEGKTDTFVDKIFRWLRREKSLTDQREEFLVEATASLTDLAAELTTNELADQSNVKTRSLREIGERVLELNYFERLLRINNNPQMAATAARVSWFSTWLHETGIKTHNHLKQLAIFAEKNNALNKLIQTASKELNDILKKSGGLKINYGDFNGAITSNKNGETPHIKTEIEAFHLLSPDLSQRDLAYVSYKDLQGSVPGERMADAAEIVEKIYFVNNKELPIAEQLVAAATVAFKMALTKLFILVDGYQSNTTYIKKMCAVEKFRELKKENPSLSPEDLYLNLSSEEENLVKEYNETQNTLLKKVSHEALLSDITRDLLKQIDGLQKPQDFCVINLGSFGHALLAEVALQKDGTYSFSLFNTGYGIPERLNEVGTTANNLKARAKPFKIEGLTKKDFHYDLIEKLVIYRLLPNEVAIPAIYDLLHNELILMAGGRDESLACPSFDQQKWGTCSYSCIDAWLQSRLTESEMKAYRYAAAEHVVDKLQKVVLAQAKEQQQQEERYKSDKALMELGFEIAETYEESAKINPENKAAAKKHTITLEDRRKLGVEKAIKATTQTLYLLGLASHQKALLAEHRLSAPSTPKIH